MVGTLLLLQGSISNLTCRIDFDSTQLDLDTWSCRLVHRIAHRKKIFKTIVNNRPYVGVGALTNNTIQ